MSRKLKLTLLLSLPLAGFLVLLGFLGLGLGNNPQDLPSALVDEPLPAFQLATLDDPERIVTQEDFKGQIALLNVWATWCTPCQLEHPVLVDLAKQGVPIFGINYKDLPGKALEWLDHLGNPYRLNVVDDSGRFGIDLGVYGLPETYLLDRHGVIRFRHAGVLDEQVWEQEFVPRIEAIEREG